MNKNMTQIDSMIIFNYIKYIYAWNAGNELLQMQNNDDNHVKCDKCDKKYNNTNNDHKKKTVASDYININNK